MEPSDPLAWGDGDMPSTGGETAEAVMTVCGPVRPAEAGITDAHNHVWIAPVAGVSSGVPVLADHANIAAELRDYRAAGGGTVVDSQPGGCGRDGCILLSLSRATGVHLVACTGFHLRRYYPSDHWLWRASADEASAYFVRELNVGLEETLGEGSPVRAGFIKVACEKEVRETPRALLEAAAAASRETGAAIMVHTERGSDAEGIVAFFAELGVGMDRLVLCHMDKRPDLGLHRDLAQRGILLEYDTFYRQKYEPERNVWPLLEGMIADGWDRQIAIATDMAEARMWARLGGGPGLVGLIRHIVPRLQAVGCGASTIRRLVGENIVNRLAYRIA
jgi:predicted metal-dependent phosphotriesterase family hydrolase